MPRFITVHATHNTPSSDTEGKEHGTMARNAQRSCNESATKRDHPLAEARDILEQRAMARGINISMTPTVIEVTRDGFRLCRIGRGGTFVPIPDVREVNADWLIRRRLGRLPEAPYRDTKKQLGFMLLDRARGTRFDAGGRPTGPLTVGDHAYLYVDMGVGCVRPFVVEEVYPISIPEFMGNGTAA